MINQDQRLNYVAVEIRRRREMMGVSQEQLGEISGLHRTYVGAIERAERNITLGTLAKLAEACSCRILDLLPPEDGHG